MTDLLPARTQRQPRLPHADEHRSPARVVQDLENDPHGQPHAGEAAGEPGSTAQAGDRPAGSHRESRQGEGCVTVGHSVLHGRVLIYGSQFV